VNTVTGYRLFIGVYYRLSCQCPSRFLIEALQPTFMRIQMWAVTDAIRKSVDVYFFISLALSRMWVRARFVAADRPLPQPQRQPAPHIIRAGRPSARGR